MRHRPPAPSRPTAAALALASVEDGLFHHDEHADRRRLRWAIGSAALAHLALFLLTFPELAVVIEPPPPPEVIRLTDYRFPPPPPPPPTPREVPRQAARRVPIPDPTPDLPEPIRPPVEIIAPLVLPEAAPLIGIPETPPPIEDPAPLRVGGEVRAPRKLFAPTPRYPEIARRAREEGLVIVEAVIDEAGAVSRARIVSGLRFGLDEAALEAIRRWRFEPATLDGEPVAVLYNLTINFRLQ